MATSPNKEELYKLGVQAVKNGQKQPARMMFQQVLQQDSRDTRAMLWMAKLAQTPDDRTQWLERVLKVNPKNETALKALHKLETRDEATRNKLYLRIGVGAYIGLVMLASVIIMVTA